MNARKTTGSDDAEKPRLCGTREKNLNGSPGGNRSLVKNTSLGISNESSASDKKIPAELSAVLIISLLSLMVLFGFFVGQQSKAWGCTDCKLDRQDFGNLLCANAQGGLFVGYDYQEGLIHCEHKELAVETFNYTVMPCPEKIRQ